MTVAFSTVELATDAVEEPQRWCRGSVSTSLELCLEPPDPPPQA